MSRMNAAAVVSKSSLVCVLLWQVLSLFGLTPSVSGDDTMAGPSTLVRV